jgi:protein TonB
MAVARETGVGIALPHHAALPPAPDRLSGRVPTAGGGESLFDKLLVSTPGHRRRFGFGFSLAAHVVLVCVALLTPVLVPLRLPEHEDAVRVLLYDPPPPPPPPLPRGSALAREARRTRPVTSAPRSRPDTLTAPMPAPPSPEALTPEAGVPETEQWGSATGSDTGVPEGMEGGVEGGVVGGVLGGVVGGVIGGTGNVPLPGRVERKPDRPPRIVRQIRPVYPQEAFVKKVEGTVVLEIVIDAEGRVAQARVLRSVPLLDDAALDAVGQWVFLPAIKAGRAVATVAEAPIVFRIY